MRFKIGDRIIFKSEQSYHQTRWNNQYGTVISFSFDGPLNDYRIKFDNLILGEQEWWCSEKFLLPPDPELIRQYEETKKREEFAMKYL